MKCARRAERRSSRALWTVGAADIPLCFSNMADIVCTPTLPLFFIASSISFSFLRRIELHARSSNFRSSKSCTTNVILELRSKPRQIVLKFNPITDNVIYVSQRLMTNPILFLIVNYSIVTSIEFPRNYVIFTYDKYAIYTIYLEMRSKSWMELTFVSRNTYRISNIFIYLLER